MWVTKRLSNNAHLTASVGGIGLLAVVFGFIIIGTPIMLISAFIEAAPNLTAGAWAIIAGVIAVIIAGCVAYWRIPDMTDEERAEILARDYD